MGFSPEPAIRPTGLAPAARLERIRGLFSTAQYSARSSARGIVDRCLYQPVGTPQVQADASPDQGRERLVRPDTPGQPNTLCSLDVMSWQRPNIGSRVTREGHARFWERPEVKFLRATRQTRSLRRCRQNVRSS